jgi:hypothetical protein
MGRWMETLTEMVSKEHEEEDMETVFEELNSQERQSTETVAGQWGQGNLNQNYQKKLNSANNHVSLEDSPGIKNSICVALRRGPARLCSGSQATETEAVHLCKVILRNYCQLITPTSEL